MEQVVAEDQDHWIAVEEPLAKEERLWDARWPFLTRVLNADAQIAAIAEELLEARKVLGCGHQENLSNAGKHESGQWVVDHRLIVYRQQLLADDHRGGGQPGPGTPREDDALPDGHAKVAHLLSRAETGSSGPRSAVTRRRRRGGTVVA